MHKCSNCGETKPLTDFHKDNKNKTGYSYRCKICAIKHVSQWQKDNAHKKRANSRRWVANNKDTHRANNKKWFAKNPDYIKTYKLKRRATEKLNGVYYISDKEYKKIYSSPCFYCGSTERIEADHIIPVSRGGNTSIGNLISCCRSCNAKKSNMLITEWRYRIAKHEL